MGSTSMSSVNWFAMSGLLIFFSLTLTAILILVRGKKDLANVLVGLFILTAGIWGLGAYIYATTASIEKAYLGWRIGYIGGVWAPILYAHFLFRFLGKSHKWLTRVMYFLGAISSASSMFFPKIFFGEMRYVFNMFYCFDWRVNKNPLFMVFYVFVYWFLLGYCFYLLFKSLRTTSGRTKDTVVLLFVGSIFGWLGPHTLFPVAFGVDAIPPIINFLIFINGMFVNYAILRYNFADVNIFFKKGLVYSVLVAIITASYFLFVSVIGEVFRGVVGYQSFALNLFVIFFLAVFFNPLKDFVQQILDRKLFHGTLETLERESQRLRQELFHAEKLAYVGQLASSVVHEIRNPLATIKTYLEYLPQKYHQPEFKTKFERLIPAEINRLEKIVSQLLGLAHQRKLVFQKVDVAHLIDTTLELLDNNFKAKDIRIEKQYDSGITINGDPEQLKQVFLNLFLNAIQAMDEAGVLTIKATIGPDDSDTALQNVEITVQDTGCGITEEQMQQLFKPFQTTKEDGIGLGLSITKEIIEQHGGTIRVHSDEGQGATFTIILPEARSGQ